MRKKKTLKKQTTNKIAKLKHHFILSIRDKSGNVVETLSHTNYDLLMLEGMEKAKELNGSWAVFNSLGVQLDGGSR